MAVQRNSMCIRHFLSNRNSELKNIIDNRINRRPFIGQWLEERVFYMCLVDAEKSGLLNFDRELRREREFVRNTLYACPPITCYITSSSGWGPSPDYVCCGSTVTKKVYLDHYELVHSRLARRPCKTCRKVHASDGCPQSALVGRRSEKLCMLMDHWLNKLKVNNYTCCKIKSVKSKTRVITSSMMPIMDTWKALVEEYEQEHGPLENEDGLLESFESEFGQYSKHYPLQDELNGMSTPFHQPTTNVVLKWPLDIYQEPNKEQSPPPGDDDPPVATPFSGIISHSTQLVNETYQEFETFEKTEEIHQDVETMERADTDLDASIPCGQVEMRQDVETMERVDTDLDASIPCGQVEMQRDQDPGILMDFAVDESLIRESNSKKNATKRPLQEENANKKRCIETLSEFIILDDRESAMFEFDNILESVYQKDAEIPLPDFDMDISLLNNDGVKEEPKSVSFTDRIKTQFLLNIELDFNALLEELKMYYEDVISNAVLKTFLKMLLHYKLLLKHNRDTLHIESQMYDYIVDYIL